MIYCLNDMYTHRYIRLYILTVYMYYMYIHIRNSILGITQLHPQKGAVLKIISHLFSGKTYDVGQGSWQVRFEKHVRSSAPPRNQRFVFHPGRQKQSKATIFQDVERSTDTV